MEPDKKNRRMTEESTERSKKSLIASSATVGTTAFAKGHSNSVTTCALSFDDRFVVSGGKDGVIYQCTSPF